MQVSNLLDAALVAETNLAGAAACAAECAAATACSGSKVFAVPVHFHFLFRSIVLSERGYGLFFSGFVRCAQEFVEYIEMTTNVQPAIIIASHERPKT